MFNRFSSLLHQAVEAIAPSVPQQQDFITQWRAVTQYFVENKEHKVSVEHTSLPIHLASLLTILVDEESGDPEVGTGPCMEYLLQHKILDTLFTLARADCPPGMKQTILLFYTKLLSQISQPLLPHINVHKPVQRMVKLCGETQAAPSENEEIQFLCTICAKLCAQPYLVNFFLQTGRVPSSPRGKPAAQSPPPLTFPLIDSLLNLMKSPDARVSVKACEGMMLCASLPEDSSAKCLMQHPHLCDHITTQLTSLYKKIPKIVDPADIYSVEAKWGLDVCNMKDDQFNFPGKRSLISFLSWLDYCDQLIAVAHPDVAQTLAESITQDLLVKNLGGYVLQPGESAAITATANLGRCIRLVSSPKLLDEFVKFILGDGVEAEETGTPGEHRFRQKLIERCNHLSEELSLTTLKLFEILLTKPHSVIMNNLLLRNLRSRSYTQSTSDKVSVPLLGLNESLCDSKDPESVPNGSCDSKDPESVPNKSCDSKDPESVPNGSCDSKDPESVPNGSCDSKDPESVLNESSSDSNDPEVMLNESQCDSKDPESVPNDPPTSNLLKLSSNVELPAAQEGDSSVNTDPDLSNTEITQPQTDSDPQEACAVPSSSPDPAGSPPADFQSELGLLKSIDKLAAEFSIEETGLDAMAVETEQPSPLMVSSTSSCDSSPDAAAHHNEALAHRIVHCFLTLLPDELKSSYHSGQLGYDIYLRDAHRQYQELGQHCAAFDWTTDSTAEPPGDTTPFYEGSFMKMLLDRLTNMLNQSYEMNLQITSVLSLLALMPVDSITEYMLNPPLPLHPRTLLAVLTKLSTDVQALVQGNPELSNKLVVMRHQLLGMSHNLRRNYRTEALVGVEDEEDRVCLCAIIVLQEFCKELAAIAFVKHQSSLHRAS